MMDKEFESILEKVSALYRKYGIKSVTMDDVAHELGISKKTIYQFVNDKTELVEKVVEHIRLCNFSDMKEIDEVRGNAIEELIEVSRHVNVLMQNHSPSYEYDLKKYYPDIYQKLMSARRKLMYESMLANIRQGKKEGVYRDELNEETIAKLHLLRVENLRTSELFEEGEVHTPKFFRELLVYHIHGIATLKGLEVLDQNMAKLDQLETH
ncbi:TetR/AcrR family transcriptional regulator [Bacteroidota bacterium]